MRFLVYLLVRRFSVHGQNHAKARLPSHHLRIGLNGFLKWNRLDHGEHAAQHTETERCVTNRGGPRQGAFKLPAPEYEIHARDLVRLRPEAVIRMTLAPPSARRASAESVAALSM